MSTSRISLSRSKFTPAPGSPLAIATPAPEYLGCRQAQLPRPEYVEDRGDDGADEHENNLGDLGLDERKQAAKRPLGILRLARRHGGVGTMGP